MLFKKIRLHGKFKISHLQFAKTKTKKAQMAVSSKTETVR